MIHSRAYTANRARIRTGLGIGISLIALVMAFHHVQWHELEVALQQAKIAWVTLGAVLVLFCHFLRAWRWQTLLKPVGDFKAGRDCFPFVMIGQMANMLLPLRMGELVQPVLFGSKHGISKSATLMTVILGRLADMVSLFVILAIVTTQISIPSQLRHAAYVAEWAVALLLGMLWLVAFDPRFANRLIRMLRHLPPSVKPRVKGWIVDCSGALASMREKSSTILVASISALTWLASVAGVQCYLKAFGLTLPWYAPLFILVVANLGMSIPSSPGFVGVAHLCFVISLSFFSVDHDVSLAFAIVVHGASFALSSIIGLLYLWKMGFTVATLKSVPT